MLHRIITRRSGFGARDERQKAINLRSSGPAGEGRHADTLGALRQWGKEALIARRCKQACTGYGVGISSLRGNRDCSLARAPPANTTKANQNRTIPYPF